jgi:hypothetical protein
VVGDVELVLGKVGQQDDDFVAGVEDRLQNYVASAGRADGHKDVFGGEGQAGFLLELAGDGLAGFRVASIGHVAVRAGAIGGHNAAQGIQHRDGRLEIGIA